MELNQGIVSKSWLAIQKHISLNINFEHNIKRRVEKIALFGFKMGELLATFCLCLIVAVVAIFVAPATPTPIIPTSVLLSNANAVTTSTFTVYLDKNDGLYKAKDQFGTICWSSPKNSFSLSSIDASIGDTVFVNRGVSVGSLSFSTSAVLTVCIAGQDLSEGQLAFYNCTDEMFYCSSASSPLTVGYGNVYLVVQNASAMGKFLLMMNSGDVSYSGWSWTPWLRLWVSKDFGSMTQSYPNSTGDQLVTVGFAINATSIHFQPPNGFSMEHS